jgi:hypothetical protein
VALSRHRWRVELYYGREDFVDEGNLVRTLSRDCGKDIASDHVITPTLHVRNPFAGIQPRAPEPQAERAPEPIDRSSALATAITRHAQIVRSMRFSRSIGEPYSPEQRSELTASRASLDAIRLHAARNLEAAMANDLGLIGQAAEGRTTAIILAMQLEARCRWVDPKLRADVFVARWQVLERQRRLFMRDQENTRADKVGVRMIGMAKSLERDSQVESILRNRKVELGLPDRLDRIGQGLGDLIGRGRSRGLGIEI